TSNSCLSVSFSVIFCPIRAIEQNNNYFTNYQFNTLVSEGRCPSLENNKYITSFQGYHSLSHEVAEYISEVRSPSLENNKLL
nr:hypothetical protein [Bacteroidota bacterium]